MTNFHRLVQVDGATSAPAPKRPNVQMPDEYLPPNKILFLQNLPESVTKPQLEALFTQCVSLLLRDSQLLATSLTPSLSGVAVAVPDTQICTKSVLSRQRRTSRSWNTSTRAARPLQKTRCTTTNSTERTKSRCASLSSLRKLYPHPCYSSFTDHFREEMILCSSLSLVVSFCL